ncbi:class I SAM-dependent methyltransferase [Streptomonospora wellingtoniae]|uniref:Methyltransferase domain-containing protein n=1 Tax=Streptomonospora wellingtoniae TaxID=3075544 RepID=A0ABU2KXL9_9ACTN|nr:methyltransferase domain-containing protein [Streptomonospora sp. DSM 45055]MDT0304008.1 methyltransferase domain-containing protein [Streptomonospora sp. DSM 45055]
MHEAADTDQLRAWNGYEGRHWADHHERYEAVNRGFDVHLLHAAAIGPDDRVLDIGCGNGGITRRTARAAHRGDALGVDLSAPMLARARGLAADEGLANVTFEQGDAQLHPFPTAAFDTAVSRFGVMFFADPAAAFANIARALRPGGRLAFLALRDPAGNDLADVFRAMAPHLPLGAADGPVSRAASLADPDGVREVLAAAGFSGARVAPVDAEQVWGADPADAAAFLCGWGPVQHLVGTGDPAADRVRASAEAAMRPFARSGAVRLRGTAWLVTATRP